MASLRSGNRVAKQGMRWPRCCRKAITAVYRCVPGSGASRRLAQNELSTLAAAGRALKPRTRAGVVTGGHKILVRLSIPRIGAVVRADRKDMAAQISPDPQGGRMLDTALGILIGLRRCRSEAAFQELLVAAQRHRVPICAMAWGLVHLTCGGDRSPETFNAAQSAARHEWGRLLAEPVVLPC